MMTLHAFRCKHIIYNVYYFSFKMVREATFFSPSLPMWTQHFLSQAYLIDTGISSFSPQAYLITLVIREFAYFSPHDHLIDKGNCLILAQDYLSLEGSWLMENSGGGGGETQAYLSDKGSCLLLAQAYLI